jgi:effector-binding domain-containing protein
MPATPEIIDRSAEPYVAIEAQVSMDQLAGLADRLGEVPGWLAERGLAPAGPPFFRYQIIDMERQLTVQAGVPVTESVSGDDHVIAGLLPAGRYASVIHVGPYDGLVAATAALRQWSDDQGLEWDKSDAGDGEHWGSRLEIYLTNPAEQPDPATWQTQLAFRLK